MVRRNVSDKGPPKISKKLDLRRQDLHGSDVFTVEGVLTTSEAQRVIDFAEREGFKHQSSRGPAHGEVCLPFLHLHLILEDD